MQSLLLLVSTAKRLALGVQETLGEGTVLIVNVIRWTETASFSCWLLLAEANAECMSPSRSVQPSPWEAQEMGREWLRFLQMISVGLGVLAFIIPPASYSTWCLGNQWIPASPKFIITEGSEICSPGSDFWL